MLNAEKNTPVGSLRISQDVIATIAGSTTTEIEGVASLAAFTSNLSGFFTRRQTVKPISIDLKDDVAAIDIRVNLRYGANIPDVAQAIQRSVKEAVQNMTGVAVTKVNVTIAGIAFDTFPLKD